MAECPAEHDRHDHLLALRTACSQRIAELNLRAAPDVQAVCDRLFELRGRPIKLVPLPMPASNPCGMWVAAQHEDIIFFDTNTTSSHQEHIILHELGHIICCHRGSGVLDDENARVLFPNLDPQIVRDMLMRATYDDVQEQEAEIIAFLLTEVMQGSAARTVPRRSADEGALGRIERTLI